MVTDQERDRFVEAHPQWEMGGEELTRTLEFADFADALGFVVRIGLIAEKMGHHPDIDIRWNKVGLRLSTHSAGGLTEKDLELAEAISAI